MHDWFIDVHSLQILMHTTILFRQCIATNIVQSAPLQSQHLRTPGHWRVFDAMSRDVYVTKIDQCPAQ